MTLYHVYIIRSLSSGVCYVGMAIDPENRLIEHNNGKSQYTRVHVPFELIYTEGPYETAVARKREKYIKRNDVKKRIISKL
ncbi:MAG: GIY-YIG nuclease family protein [Bacteroidota bacterium]